MPWTPPATYDSVVNTGYRATIAFGDTSSPPNFTALAEVKSFTVTPLDVPNVDVTHLLSRNNTRELRPGMIMPGTAEVSGNWVGDSTQLAIPTDAEAQTVIPFQAKFATNNGTQTVTYAGTCFVKTLKLGPIENDKPNEFSMTFQCEGAFTIAVA